MELPNEVKTNVKFLKSKKVWHILTINHKAVSCSDAANKRHRLGHIGIPIFDELKSELGFFVNKENKKQKVLIHCRGNQKLDRLKISNILNSEYQRLSNISNSKGLINPFGKRFRNLMQIFDVSTTKLFHPPYTMMTNAGDFTYAFEFEVNSLINSLKYAIVDDVIRFDNYNNFIRHKIGLLTGNGPDSGILLWKKINDSIKAELNLKLNNSFRGDLSYPEVVIESVPDMGISMELDKRLDATEKTVVRATVSLCQRSATLICIACNTTQFFRQKVEEVCQLYNVRFISIPEVVEDYLLKNNIKSFDFLGISYVADFNKFSAFKSLQKKYNISIPNSDVLKRIEEIAFLAKKDIDKSANLLRDLIQNKTQNNTIIIVLTEISTILSLHRKLIKDKVVVDSLQLLADYIARIFVLGIFDTLYVDRENIIFAKLDKEGKEKVKLELWKILCEIDYEFIPPLSYRDSTTFVFGSDHVISNKPKAYFEKLLTQEIIVSIKQSNNQVVGFMSYIPNHIITNYDTNFNCFYITTIGVTKGVRGNGITQQFYKLIEKIAENQEKENIVATRTWSTNRTHIQILLSLGYKQVIKIDNDRGAGIHTVYYAKKVHRIKAETPTE